MGGQGNWHSLKPSKSSPALSLRRAPPSLHWGGWGAPLLLGCLKEPGCSCAGILLYYHYTDLSQSQHETAQWMQALCTNLGLRGRVRVAEDGVGRAGVPCGTTCGTDKEVQAPVCCMHHQPANAAAAWGTGKDTSQEDQSVHAPARAALHIGACRACMATPQLWRHRHL